MIKTDGKRRRKDGSWIWMRRKREEKKLILGELARGRKKKRVRERDQNSDTKAINNNEPPQRDRLYPGI